MAPIAAGVQAFACGTNWTMRIVTELAKSPALTFAVGAQLLAVAAGFGTSRAIAVLAMINLLKFGLS
jgi:hypothetical protein